MSRLLASALMVTALTAIAYPALADGALPFVKDVPAITEAGGTSATPLGRLPLSIAPSGKGCEAGQRWLAAEAERMKNWTPSGLLSDRDVTHYGKIVTPLPAIDADALLPEGHVSVLQTTTN